MRRIAVDSIVDSPSGDAGYSAGNERQARLSLGFTDDAGTTRMTERSHFGPLRMQKPLYPENPAVCHAIVVHPPGGVVGGDELQIAARVGDNAHAFITTPGAAKWYKANGRISKQDIRLEAGAGASLEWLPLQSPPGQADSAPNRSISAKNSMKSPGLAGLAFMKY